MNSRSATGVKPGWTIPPELKWEVVNGYPMSFRDIGSGPPIVLVHGSLNDYRTWNSQFIGLSAEHRVIAVNLRHSYPERWDGSGSDFSIEQHAEDVAALIKTLHLGKVHLVGHSRGGAVITEVGKCHAEVIRTFVLVDGSIDIPVPQTAEAREASEFTKRLLMTLRENLKTKEPSQAAEIFVDMLNRPGTWTKLSDAGRDMRLANIYTALGDESRPLTTCDDLQKFDFPVLLMTGDRSPKKFEFFYNEMRKCRPFAETIIIPNAGHAMHGDNPQAFNKRLLTFIGQHER